ncbi:hypothetical protein [Rhizobacter sp. SG703]|uniref:hypothetical protein n=1 Tax=Rhizobacter sp. SG703 TaxID=2587140 RepID=UPI001445C317|nr:hypothetical protein [Rhizobacter sp. SG703]NKI93736.1 hypothetical protein [Rhizobacter sp. SG703]
MNVDYKLKASAYSISRLISAREDMLKKLALFGFLSLLLLLVIWVAGRLFIGSSSFGGLSTLDTLLGRAPRDSEYISIFKRNERALQEIARYSSVTCLDEMANGIRRHKKEAVALIEAAEIAELITARSLAGVRRQLQQQTQSAVPDCPGRDFEIWAWRQGPRQYFPSDADEYETKMIVFFSEQPDIVVNGAEKYVSVQGNHLGPLLDSLDDNAGQRDCAFRALDLHWFLRYCKVARYRPI